MFVALFRYAVILAFDVRIEREAQEMADNLGVRVFSADIIYHLFDKFTAYREVRQIQRLSERKVTFPMREGWQNSSKVSSLEERRMSCKMKQRRINLN